MTEAQKIQEAYGEHWETVKSYVDENGKINTADLERAFFDKNLRSFLIENRRLFEVRTLFIGHLYTLISLRGIENNRGWIKIESEADLPKDENKKYITGLLLTPESISEIYWKEDTQKSYCAEVEADYHAKIITHYRVVENYPAPIY